MSLSGEHRSAIRSWVEENWESYMDDADSLDEARDNMEANFQAECDLTHLSGGDLAEAIDFLEDTFYDQ